MALRLQTVLDFLREGDVLIVTRIDRLAGSIGDLPVEPPSGNVSRCR
jgi:hypothetical protein